MKEIVVTNGEYPKRDGGTGVNWIKVGVLGVSQNGKEYVILEPHINLAGLPRSEKGGIMCSVIDKSQQNQSNNSQTNNYSNQGGYNQNQPQQQQYNQPNSRNQQNGYNQQQYQQPQNQYNADDNIPNF